MPKTSTAARKIDYAEALLSELYHATAPYIQKAQWEFESDRWAELLICAWLAGAGIEPALARETMANLSTLDLIQPGSLAALSTADRQLIEQILARHGFPAEAIPPAVDLLCSIAQLTVKQWNGHLQGFLREAGTRMLEELTPHFISAGLSPGQARKLATLWLQNVANLPILLADDIHVQGFMQEYSLSEQELLAAADKLNLNVAVLDDLLTVLALAGSPDSDSEKAHDTKKRARSHKTTRSSGKVASSAVSVV